MDGKVNTPRTVCKAIVAVAIAAVVVAAIIGCESIVGGTRRQNIAAVIQTAYDMGGREAVSNKIESLVAEGKLTPSQAYPPSEASAAGGSMRGVRLHALAQLAYEGLMDDLATVSPERSDVAGGELNAGCDAVTNAAPASASQGGCTDCSLPDASAGSGDCNEDARCGKCADCKGGE